MQYVAWTARLEDDPAFCRIIFYAVIIMQRLLCGNDCADICFMKDHSFNAAIILRTAILWGRVLSRTR